MDFEKMGIKIEENVSRPETEAEVAMALLDRLKVNDCAIIPQAGQYRLLAAIKAHAKRTGYVIQVETGQSDGHARVWMLARGRNAVGPGDVREFIQDECTIAEGLAINKTLLYRAFCQWAELKGKAPMSSILFSKDITRMGFLLDKSQKMRFGLRLKPAQNKMQGNEIIA